MWVTQVRRGARLIGRTLKGLLKFPEVNWTAEGLRRRGVDLRMIPEV